MTEDYMIGFLEDGECEFFKGNGSNGEIITFKKDEIKLVNETDMFKWLEATHDGKVKIVIYKARIICDLS